MAAKVAYEFGGFRFEPANARLVYGTTVVPLTIKAADTLTVLVTRPEILVTKDDLMATVWPDAVVEENNLNQQISVLRKALSQNGNGSFIETVPRRGFRFVGKVRVVSQPSEALEVASAREDAAPVEPAQVRTATSRLVSRPGYSAAFVAALLGVGVAGLVVWEWQQRAPVKMESREATTRGNQLMRHGDARGAATEFQDAVRLDPNNASAYSALAHALHKQSYQDSVPRAGRSPSVEAAQRAVSIDPECALCHGTLGLFLFYHDWEWTKAEEHLTKAIRLGPDHEGIRPSYAMLLAATGRASEAERQIDIALAKQPYYVTWRVMRATFLYLQRRYPEAIAAADEALTLKDDERTGWEWRSRALFQMGRRVEAVRALAQGAFSTDSAAIDRAVRESGGDAGLRWLLAKTDPWPGPVEQCWRRGPWFALLDERDAALTELERALEYRNVNLVYVGVDPVYDGLRSEPRFQRILVAMGLDSVLARPEELVRRQ